MAIDRNSLRGKLFITIFGAHTRNGRQFDLVLLWLILLSVLTVCLESVPSIRSEYHPILHGLEVFFTAVFSIEYILRVYSHPKPLKYLFSFFGIIDLLSIIPFYLTFILPAGHFLVTIRIIRLLRVFRILKLTSFVHHAHVLKTAIIASLQKITVFMLTIIALVLIIGTVMYVVEGEEHGFTSIPQSIYWAIVTITTVGYGDLTPQTPLGQVISSIVMIMGYAIIAVPTGIVTVEMSRSQPISKRANSIECLSCGKAMPVNSNYCSNCGHQLHESSKTYFYSTVIFQFMRTAFLLILLISIFSNASGGGIRGTITTQKGEPLPYTGLSVKGTSNGTMANDDGKYEFTLAPGSYEITFQYLGFKTITKPVTVTTEFIELNVQLEEQALILTEANIGSGKEDPAYSVMRKAIAKARFHQLQVRGYTAKVYARSTALPTKIPFLVEKRLKKEGVQEGKSIVNESVSEVKYTRPSSYNQKIISTRNSLDNSIPSPNEYILASLYSPEIAGTISPLSPKAFGYYKFEYEGYFEDRGVTVNKIRVIPKAYGEGVFKGSLFIIEERWAIHSYDLQTTTSGLTIAAKQVFSPVQNVWLPVNQQFKINGGYLGFAGEFRYLVSVTYNKLDVDPGLKEDIVINDHKKEAPVARKADRKKELDKLISEQKDFSTKNFRKLTRQYEKEQKKEQKINANDRMVRSDSIVVDSMANKRDTTYWANLRTIPLTISESKSYVLQDSIKVIKDAENEKKQPDSTHFKLRHLATGNTYSLGNRNTFYFKSPLLSISYNAVEGNALNIITEWQKKWGKSHQFSLRPLARYSFGRKRLYGNVEASIGNNNWTMMLSGGEMASQYNRNNPILPFPNSIAGRFFDQSLMKLYQQRYIRADYSLRNIGDILGFDVSLEYEKRKELFNQPSSRPIFLWDRFGYTPNKPVNNELSDTGFDEHNALLFDITAHIRPWRRYLIRNGEKRYLRSRGPSFAINYKSGLPVVGDIDYSLLQATIRQNLNIGPRSSLDYSINGGGFLSKNKLYFQDYRHFMGNEFFFLWGDTPYQFKMLPYYTYSTSEWFFQAHAVWSLQHFLLTRIEPLRVTGLSENLQIHYLKVPTISNYSELVYGIANIYRVVKLEAVAQFHGTEFQRMGFRIGTTLRIGR